MYAYLGIAAFPPNDGTTTLAPCLLVKIESLMLVS